jgi:hypothetical protein
MESVVEKAVYDKYLSEYHNMLYKRAHEVSAKYKVEFSEVLSDAYEIFCKAVNTYDDSIASFSTHLCCRLDATMNKSRTRRKIMKSEVPPVNFAGESDSIYPQYNEVGTDLIMDDQHYEIYKCIDRLESALELSDDAQQIIEFLLSREWETPGINNRVPRFSATRQWVRRELKWPNKRIIGAWNEIGKWMHGINHAYA